MFDPPATPTGFPRRSTRADLVVNRIVEEGLGKLRLPAAARTISRNDWRRSAGKRVRRQHRAAEQKPCPAVVQHRTAAEIDQARLIRVGNAIALGKDLQQRLVMTVIGRPGDVAGPSDRGGDVDLSTTPHDLHPHRHLRGVEVVDRLVVVAVGEHAAEHDRVGRIAWERDAGQAAGRIKVLVRAAHAVGRVAHRFLYDAAVHVGVGRVLAVLHDVSGGVAEA